MPSIRLAKIIPYEKICGFTPEYKLMKKMTVTRTIMKSHGRALGIVHPLWCEKNWYKEGAMSENYDTVAPVSRDNYNSYLNRLSKRIANENGVIFLFSSNMKSALNWVAGIKTGASFVMIKTTSFGPTPYLPKHTTRADRWKTLALTLRNLGVTKLTLAGELDIKVMGSGGVYNAVSEKKNGCVNIAFDNLSPFLEVKKAASLTFPGDVFIDPFGIVLNEW